MMMVPLHAENRNLDVKPKRLRREGMVPGVLYGKNLKESLNIQLSRADATRFLKANSVGSKAELELGSNKFSVLLRKVTVKPTTDELEHLSFQTLLADEVVTSMARVLLINREKVTGMIQQPQSEISYRALPSNLVDRVEIDLDGMKIGDSMRISDLDMAKNPDIEILSPLDTLVFSIIDTRKPMETSETDDEASTTEHE